MCTVTGSRTGSRTDSRTGSRKYKNAILCGIRIKNHIITFKINLSSRTITVTVTVTGSRTGSGKYEDAILCEIRSIKSNNYLQN